MADRAQQAVAVFRDGFNCSQAVLAVFAEDFGLERPTALRLACGFGGGMRMGGPCGALSGACMAIGLKYGKTRADDNQARDKTYALVQQLAARFRALHGTILCRDLIGCDISTPQGYEEAKQKKVFLEICPGLVADAVKILEELL
ncbi:MAG: C-GCAxxG-C-C family protein [Syntrophaceae bacterium]